MLSADDLSDLIKKSDPSVSYYNPLETDNNSSKKRKRSEHWNGFRRILVNDVKQNYIICGNCQILLKWRTDDGTNVMKKHMIGCKSHSAVPSSFSQSISTFFTVDIRNKSRATRLAKHKLKKAIAECCILDSHPFALADGPGFQ
ncbi:unnamed protein product, partial [Rotaria sp. Silwood2]